MKTPKNLLRKPWVQTILCHLAVVYIRFVYATGVWKTKDETIANDLLEAGRPFVLAFWHGRLLMMSYAWQHKTHANILISDHSDGRFIGRLISHFGIPSIVGSTTRGGRNAMRTIIRTLRNGGIVGITPDGPRGPRMRSSDGIIAIARLTDVPILPLAYSTSKCRILRTWDKFMLPLPFGRGVFLWGHPIIIPPNSGKTDVEAKRLELENSLIDLTSQADQLMGHTPVRPEPLPNSQKSFGEHDGVARKSESDNLQNYRTDLR